LAKPGGSQVLRRLVETADVVIANLPAEALVDMGLDYASVSAIRPDIILTSISAFGPNGPYSKRVGFDGVGQAMCGAAYLSGTPGQPMKAAASWVDMTTAILSAFGTLAALQERARTGRGQEVRSSLLGTALTTFNWLLMEEALTGLGREATGNRSQSGGPADFFRTRDGWITVQVIGDPLFRRWTALVGEPDWLNDERFQSDAARAKNGAVLSERTARWCGSLTTAEAVAALERARIPAGPILSPRQVLEDVHVRETNMLTPMDYPGLEAPAPLVFAGLQLGETPSGLRRRAPQLGEHTTEILTSLGYSGAEIDALRGSRTI